MFGIGRKIKNSLKKTVNWQPIKKVHARVTKIGRPKKRPAKSEDSSKAKTSVENQPIEVKVGESKFYTPPKVEEAGGRSVGLTDLPSGYGQSSIILQVRDPWWLHAYWEVNQSSWERLKRELPAEFSRGFKKILRVYDVSHIIFTGNNAHRYFDIEINQDSNNWYINTQGPGRSWCVDLGLLFSDGRFITIVRSNTASTPLAGPSCITDEEWMIPEDMFLRLYGIGVGIGSSPLNLKKLWAERLKGEFGSGALFSAASPMKRGKGPKGFWLVVNTELIVYGQTEPDAKLTVGGRPVELRPDGSFSLRFFLPDGKQVIPVVATSSDGEQKRSIIPIVNKETR